MWKSPYTYLVSALALVGLSLPVTAGEGLPLRHEAPNYRAIPGQKEFTGRLIVRPRQLEAWRASGFSESAASARVAAAHQGLAVASIVRYVPQTDEYVVELPEGLGENEAAGRLMATGLYQYAEPDWMLYPLATPNDSRFGNQWHHDPNRMQSEDGWNIHTGTPSVAVGICDTGIRTTHEDFQLHRLEGYNAVDRVWESQGGNIGAVHPHGTMTSGCAAANGNNGKGIAGVGWDLSHRMMRVSNSSGGGAYSSDLQHAARTSIEAGDRVASVSYSGADSSSNLTTATYIKSIGGLLVWAAGNDGRNLTYGNRDNDDLIVVGATDSGDALAYFSAYGQFVDVTAPGVSVYTTDSGSNSDYAAVSGTSFACPLTAGLAALIWSADPTLTPDEVEQRLKAGCDDLGSGGIDNTYGYGRINVYGSLSQGGPPANQPPSAAISASPASGVVVLDVDFDASASFDSDGTIVEYEWDLDGNGSFETSTGLVPTAQHSYATVGSYDVSVRVTDDDDATDTASVLVTVTEPVNESPVASLSATPTSGDIPLFVSFDASASFDPDGYLVEYEWDFDGDGTFETSTGTTAYAQFTYTAAGTYGAAVRVTDDGDATDTATVVITATDPNGQPELLASDDFESKSFSGGAGWSGPWSTSGDITIRWRRDGPHGGNGHARLRSSSGYMTRVVDLAGVTQARLEYWGKAYSFEKSDQLHVLVSPDGSNWTLVQVFDQYDDDNQYHQHSIDLSGFAMTSTFHIAFDAQMNGTGDRFWVDDVEIIGVR